MREIRCYFTHYPSPPLSFSLIYNEKKKYFSPPASDLADFSLLSLCRFLSLPLGAHMSTPPSESSCVPPSLSPPPLFLWSLTISRSPLTLTPYPWLFLSFFFFLFYFLSPACFDAQARLRKRTRIKRHTQTCLNAHTHTLLDCTCFPTFSLFPLSLYRLSPSLIRLAL